MSIAASARARDSVPVETLWHIQAIEVAAGAPWYLSREGDDLRLRRRHGTCAGHGLSPRLDGPSQGVRRYVVRHLAVDPSATNRLFTVTDNSEVIASEDGGLTWAALHSRYIDAQP